MICGEFSVKGIKGSWTRVLVSAALILCSLQAFAPAHAAPLFESDEPLEFTLEAPLATLFGPLLNAEEYVEAKLTMADGSITALPVEIRPRGKTRRNPDICTFPPLRVNFKKSSVVGTVFEGQDKIKLVTHCNDRRTSYQTYYRQEFYIYRTYNLITDESFRVRAANITYVDTDGKRKTKTAFAFFIEEADALAERTGMTRIQKPKLTRPEYNAAKASVFALFQYMIGNLDWATLGGPAGEDCCHNSKPFLHADGKAVPVPYDFDFSGVVNATYASPPEGIELRSMKTRLFRGFCYYNDTLPAAAALLNEKRADITALYQEAESLKENDAKRTLRYYDGFYKTINDASAFDRRIVKKCRGKSR